MAPDGDKHFKAEAYMANKLILEEARLVNMTDEELVDLVGSLFEGIKRLDEAMKSDEQIEKMTAELKDYRDTKYLDNKRKFASKLKAARAFAKVRGLKFNIPMRSDDE
jgi:hypothetical protein